MLEAVFLFCANAAAGSDGKLDIHGIFNELYAPDFPARQDRIVLAGIIEWQRDVQGRIPFTIDLADPQGLSIFTIEGHTDVGVRTAAQAPAKTQVVFPMENVMFPAPGRYRIRVNVDGTEISGPSLHLLRSNTD